MNKIFLIFLIIIISQVKFDLAENFDQSQIILFYAPLNSESLRGQIVIYWYIPNFIEGDTLNLYFGTPILVQILPIYSFKLGHKSGVIKTGVPPTSASYDLESSFVQQCTGYYGAWVRNATFKKLSCLSTYPDWMSKQKDRLQYMTLGNLFIPGTHNSGSYNEEIPLSFTDRYTVTQDKPILDQLISGARYLDLRPCKYKHIYWICHGLYYMQPFEAVIDDIKEFMNHTDEIVILSFKEFPGGFSSDDHKDFTKYLSINLIEHIASSPFESQRLVTLGELWRSRKRLILSYDYDLELISSTLDHLQFWFPINQEWGNVNSDIELKKFINLHETYAEDVIKFCTEPLFLRAMMAEVTLDLTSIVKDAVAHMIGQGNNSLREISAKVGPLVTSLYNENYNSSANIVAVDFIDATGIVPVAIHWNKIRSDNFYEKYIKKLNTKP